MISETEFEELARQGYNRIALVAEAPLGPQRAISLYASLAQAKGDGRHSFLLESVVKGARPGRYAYIGLPCRTLVRNRGRVTEVVVDGKVVERHEGNPLAFIAAYQHRFKVALPTGLPPFCGGLAGYFGYETIRHIERKLADVEKPCELDTPDIMLLQCEELAIVDNLAERLQFVVLADPRVPDAYSLACQRLAEIAERRKCPPPPVMDCGAQHAIENQFPQVEYENAVRKAKGYIAAGDVMQVVLCQRSRKRFTGSPLALYGELSSLNPSPYMYYYDMGDFHIVGASPEILVRQERDGQGRVVTIRPIAGTRGRGLTPEHDFELEADLLTDQKERAEHLMLVDLARNDLGRIAETGSVRVTETFGIERYSHVMHIVSNVEGRLRSGLSDMDVLHASFPAGTLSGAPKIRAMEIIDELEPIKRGIYGGAVGYLSFAGDMDLAIAIRTGVVKDRMLYVQAGAGVVADSVPELEWKETEAKARAVLQAASRLEEGLSGIEACFW